MREKEVTEIRERLSSAYANSSFSVLPGQRARNDSARNWAPISLVSISLEFAFRSRCHSLSLSFVSGVRRSLTGSRGERFVFASCLSCAAQAQIKGTQNGEKSPTPLCWMEPQISISRLSAIPFELFILSLWSLFVSLSVAPTRLHSRLITNFFTSFDCGWMLRWYEDLNSCVSIRDFFLFFFFHKHKHAKNKKQWKEKSAKKRHFNYSEQTKDCSSSSSGGRRKTERKAK